MHFHRISLALIALLASFGLAVLFVRPIAAAELDAAEYGYSISNYDESLLHMRRNLDRFWGDPYMTPGNENKWFTAPGISWLNEAGGTATACGNMEAAEADRRAFFYCRLDKVIYVDYSQMRALQTEWGYDGVLAMLAHEYGHHLQNLLGRWDSDTRTKELQADCLSGTALRWFDTWLPLLDRAELGRLAYSTGGGSLENLQSHGSGEQRQRWWLYGWDQPGQFACLSATYY